MSALLTRSIRHRSMMQQLPRGLAMNTAGLGIRTDQRLLDATTPIVQAAVESARKVSAVETKAQRSKRLKRERDARYRTNKKQAERVHDARRSEPNDVFAGRTTMTGREVSEPNLQNIPIHTEEGKRIRLAFVPQ